MDPFSLEPYQDLIEATAEGLLDSGKLPPLAASGLKYYFDNITFIDMPAVFRGFEAAERFDADTTRLYQTELVTLLDTIEDLEGETIRALLQFQIEEGTYSDEVAFQIRSVVKQEFGPIKLEIGGLIKGWGISAVLGDVRDIFSQCFVEGTMIDMWPLDSELKVSNSNSYDQAAVRAAIWRKPIEEVSIGDLVVAFDAAGMLVPGHVPQITKKDVEIVLNFFGTHVTPGHIYYRPDSKSSHKFEPLIDILRDDGLIEDQVGSVIRAATNVPVGDPRDRFVKIVTGTQNGKGTTEPKEVGRIRLGTRFVVGDGDQYKSFAVYDLISAAGGVVGDDEMVHIAGGESMPFHWEFADTLPKPEDFVLTCSGTSLEEIYKAAEWENHAPRLPAPVSLDGKPVRPSAGLNLKEMAPNVTLKVKHVSASVKES